MWKVPGYLLVSSAHLSPAGGSMEWCPAIRVLYIHLNTLLYQQFRHRNVAVSRRYMELEEMLNINPQNGNAENVFIIYYYLYL